MILPMSNLWVRERSATWDEAKRNIIGSVPSGVFDRRYTKLALGERLPGDWWRVEQSEKIVGYGWMDIVWGDAEILMAVSEKEQGSGLGTFILENLTNEAKNRGVNYVYNVVRPTHPDADTLRTWLEHRGFRASVDGSLLRSVR